MDCGPTPGLPTEFGSALMWQARLVDYSFRYFGRAAGCFLSRNPIIEAGGSSLCGSIENDPVNGWDHLGLVDKLICDRDEFGGAL